MAAVVLLQGDVSHTYLIQTLEYGTLRKEADCIRDARQWAKRAFGVGPQSVSREMHFRYCDRCACAPCNCPKRQKAPVNA